MGKSQIKRRAVFLDRDGVLNRPTIRDGKPYPPSGVAEFELYEDVAEGCVRLKASGFLLVVITNQPDVGRGTQGRETVEAMHREVRRAVTAIDRIEVCYHAGARYGQACECRKPKAGMILRATADLAIDLGASYVIGDRWRDIDCAHAAGCRAIFLDRSYSEPLSEPPDFTVTNFADAVDVILRDAAAFVSCC